MDVKNIKNMEFLEILRFLDKVPNSSQRKIAKSLGFNLGKINYILKSFTTKRIY